MPALDELCGGLLCAGLRAGYWRCSGNQTRSLSSESLHPPPDLRSASAPFPEAGGRVCSCAGPWSIPVSPVLLLQTGVWLAAPEAIKASCSVSGKTPSVTVLQHVGATVNQHVEGTGELNSHLLTVFLGQVSPPASAAQSRHEEPSWLGV